MRPSTKADEAGDSKAPDFYPTEDYEALDYEEGRPAQDGRQRMRRGSKGSILNPKHFMKELGARRKMMRQSIWGVLVFYAILVCLAGIAFLVASRLYNRMLWRVYNQERLVPSPTASHPPLLTFDRSFDTSLGCSNAALFNRTLITSPTGSDTKSHRFWVTGGASTLITLASSPVHEHRLFYDIVLKGNATNAQATHFTSSTDNSGTTFRVASPSPSENSTSSDCVCVEVTVYIPKSLKGLTVSSETDTHITFAPDAHIELDHLTLEIQGITPDESVLFAQPSLLAKSMTVKVEGWIVGELTLVDELSIHNTNGSSKFSVTPSAPTNFDTPNPAVLKTTTGGQLELTYQPNQAYRRRPIDSSHVGIGAGQMLLGYLPANASGTLDLHSPTSFTQKVVPVSKNEAKLKKWTHYFGQKGGFDNVSVNSLSHVTLLI